MLLGRGSRSAIYRCTRVYGIHRAACSTEGTKRGVRRPAAYWEEAEVRRKFMDQVAAAHGVEKPEDWSRVSKKDVIRMGGSGLLRRYDSLLLALRDVYPDMDVTDKHLRKQLPSGYWKDAENRKSFLLAFAADKGIDVEKPEAWKAVTTADIVEYGGKGFLKHYGISLVAALQDLLPEMATEVSRMRGKMPAGHWESAKNRRSFMDRVKEVHGIREARDWKKVRHRDIVALGGHSLLLRYASVFDALRDVYPEADLELTEVRERAPNGYWDDQSNRRRFLDSLAEKWQLEKAEDWSRVTKQQMLDEGGRGLFDKYPSTWELLKDVYGEAEEWDAFACRSSMPSGFWAIEENVKQFIDMAKVKLKISKKEDWYRVSQQQVVELGGGGGLLAKMTLTDALRLAYPNETWEDVEAKKTKKSSQRALALAVFDIMQGTRPAAEQSAQ